MNQIILIGILCGISAALFQASSYFFSRRFLLECRSSTTLLFGVSHVQMGVAAVVLLTLVLDRPLPPFPTYAWQLAGTSGFYLVGQWLIFIALKHSNSSVVAPLLGLKIPLLGLISATMLGVGVPPLAWLAIGMCTAAAIMVSPPRGLPAMRTLTIILLACLGYCGSDIFIPRLVSRIDTASDNPVLLGVALTYIVCGLAGLIVSLKHRALANRRVQKYALPYSFCWFTGMCFLFAAFANIGVIFGNMLQSTRGLISVLIGITLTKAGFSRLEQPASSGLLIIRLAGALLMTAGIITYYLTA